MGTLTLMKGECVLDKNVNALIREIDAQEHEIRATKEVAKEK